MLCTFCGTDNRAENKFCGMCGVRLERRKVERRVHQPSTSAKCPSCDHLNEQGFKFCAMCGARVDRRVSERRSGLSEPPRATAVANAQLPGPEGPPVATADARPATEQAPQQESTVEERLTPNSVAPIFRSTPARRSVSIAGPSFLGLNGDEDEGSDYLLEDEGGSVGVLRKLVLLAVLAAVGGLVFLQWRSGFPVFHANQRSDGSARTGSSSSSPEQVQNSSITTEETGAASEGGGLTKEPAAPAASALVKDRLPDLTPPEKAAVIPPIDVLAAKDARATESVPASDRSKVAKGAKEDQDKPSPMLLRAQQYLQGTAGLAQNCDQGLVYLRAAAKSEAAAAAQMGVLYASGHCVRQDRVTAYRWFNSAHELQPGNSRIQTSMNQLWAQMTSQERSQVIR